MRCYVFGIFTLVTIVLMTIANGQEVSTCEITSTSCPCTMRESSGSCMQYQGHGKCLLGECSEGYKCDCLAYEKCKIWKCPKYTTLKNVIPSAETAFPCHLTKNAGTCTSFAGFVDTLAAADAAERESTHSLKGVSDGLKAAMHAVLALHEEKVAVDAALEQLDAHANKVPELERAQVEEEAATVADAVARGMAAISALHVQLNIASDADLRVSSQRRIAYARHHDALRKREQLQIELKKMDESQDTHCQICPQLKTDITHLNNGRRHAVIETGKGAHKTRAAFQNSKDHAQNLVNITRLAKSARERAVALTENILKHLK